MDILSNSPLPTGSLVWRPRPDAWVLTVFCKSTYTLSPGQSFLAPASMQEAPVLEDRWVGGVGEGSLLLPSDALPFKRYVDVIVLGHVHTAKHPVPSLIASLSVGPVHKSIEVWADRFWNPAGKLLVENAFAAMPIRWERSSGGLGSENPVGIPIPAPPNDQGLRPLPNFQPPGFAVSTPYDRIPIVGFGPIAPTWPEREGRLRQYAYGWDHMRYISHPLPGDIDAAYFNASSADMGLPEFEGTETLSLIHLHFEHNWLVTKLALQKPKALVRKPNIPEYPIKLRCDTLTIDTDKGICSLVYRGLLPLAHAEEEGHIEFSMDAPPVLQVPQPFVGTDSDSRRKTGPLPVMGLPQPQPEPEDLSKTIPFPEGAGDFPLAPPPGIKPEPFMGALGGPASTIPPPPLPSPATLPPPPLPLAPSVPPPPPLVAAPPPLPSLETPAPFEEPEGLNLLRLAALSAELAEGPAQGPPRPEGVSPEELDRWRARFEQEVERESKRGQSHLRERFDQAYVEALAPLRGPVLLGEFAALLVGMERGNVNEVLHALALHPASLMPILRHWTKRSAADAERAQELVAALSAERQKE